MKLQEKTIGEIVATNYRTAAVFKNHKIDFCCKGNRSLDEVCEEKKINKDSLLNELKTASAVKDNSSIDFKSWDMDLLADYIEKKHHRYVNESIP